MKTVCLDLHDFTPVCNRFDVLLKLKKHFPDFKVSLLAIPYDEKRDYGPTLIRRQLLKEVKKNLSWIQLIPHGLVHSSSDEFRTMSYEQFKNEVLPKIKKGFEDDGLPYENGFGAPHWNWSPGVVKALDEIGWFGMVRREKDIMLRTKRFYQYTHLLNEPFWESDLPVLKLHGHVYGTRNDVGDCLENLLKLPKDTKFTYATEHIETA